MNVGATSPSAAKIAQSTEALNKVMQSAQTKTLDQAEKLMKLSVQTALGVDPDKGNAIDCSA